MTIANRAWYTIAPNVNKYILRCIATYIYNNITFDTKHTGHNNRDERARTSTRCYERYRRRKRDSARDDTTFIRRKARKMK